MKKTPAPPTKSTFNRGKWLIAHCSLLLAISAPAWAQQDATPAVPSAVNIGAAVIPGIMDALLQQHKTPQQLWDDGRLTADLLPDVLNQQPLGRTENQQAAHQLCALLVKQLPQELDDPLALPPRTRLRLAQYFKSIKDARAVTFYEAILSLIKAPREAGVREVFQLSDYYTETGDWEKAAETRLRMKDYTTAEPYLANANVEAARMYVQHGQEEKAQPLYERAEKSSYGWAAGVALLDHGRSLMRLHKYDEAIKVLSTPIAGLYADQIEPIKRMLIGDIYYAQGDLPKAQENMQAALASFHAVENPIQGEGLETIFTSAAKRLQLIEQWTKEPIQVEPKSVQLKVTAEQLQKGPVVQRLRVRTYRDMPLTVAINDTNITAQLLSANEWSVLTDKDANEISEKEVIIKVNSLPSNKSAALLTISSANDAGTKVQIPVNVEVVE